MLPEATSRGPFRANQICRFPPPRSGPLARNSTSVAQFDRSSCLSDHTAPRWLPGAGGVRITLLERSSGRLGEPWTEKLGMEFCPSGFILHEELC